MSDKAQVTQMNTASGAIVQFKAAHDYKVFSFAGQWLYEQNYQLEPGTVKHHIDPGGSSILTMEVVRQ